VVSIPDYAFTPFGQASGNRCYFITDRPLQQICENYCEANSISFIFITDITRQGLANKSLVASDGYPSELAYSLFVEQNVTSSYCNSQLKNITITKPKDTLALRAILFL
jgi:hypothetical protein